MGFSLFATLLATALPVYAAQAKPEKEWGSDEVGHFIFHHEAAGSALGEYNRFERIYDTLHRELWSLLPWMSDKKTKVYLYSDRESYRGGMFQPPEWSGGLLSAVNGEKSLAVFSPINPSIVAHELTHMYFHTYFEEKIARPPSWLDEGLASMLQNEAVELVDARDKGPVLSAYIPAADFFKSRPDKDSPGAWVGAWYQQAHSYVRFLKREHIESQFIDFCAKLREGKDSETALREVYGYADAVAFEAAWLKWRPRRAVGRPVGLE